MRKLSSLITGAALTLTAGVLGCGVDDIDDPFDSLTTVANEEDTTGDGDGDATGDGDGDATGDGDGDATGDGDGDATGDGDGDAACGGLGEGCCAGDVCDAGLSCDGATCGLGGGDGDGDPTDTGDGDASWDPADCPPPGMVLGVGMIEGDFCSQPCQGAMDMSCPPGPEGTFAQCALTTMGATEPSFCALVCQVAQDACPAGSSCKDLMDPANPGLGLCTFP